LQNTIAQYDKTIARLEQQYAADKEQLDAQHKQRLQRLYADVKELKDALLTRDDGIYEGEIFTPSGIPSKSDEKIRTQFLEMHQMVENLGRIEWKVKQKIWTDDVLLTAGKQPGQRLVRKAVVQDLIW